MLHINSPCILLTIPIFGNVPIIGKGLSHFWENYYRSHFWESSFLSHFWEWCLGGVYYIILFYSFLYSTHFWERPFPFLGKPFPFLGKSPIFYRITFPIFGKPFPNIGKIHSHFWEKVGTFPIFGNGSEVKNKLFPIFGNGTFPIFGNLFLFPFPIFGKIIAIPIFGNGTFCKSRPWIKHALINISQFF